MDEPSIPSLVITPETVLIAPGDRTMIAAPFTTLLPDGTASIPAQGFGMSQFHAEDGQAYILVQLVRHRIVLHEAFTPEAARLLAKGKGA